MRCKFLYGRKSTSRRRPQHPKQPSAPAEKRSSALRIVHAGGLIERHYMAVPAARIMEKYPSFVLARPEVFRLPWNSLVRPDEILIPGQKFFVVPRRTVVKLRRRIKRPSSENLVDVVDLESSSYENSGKRSTESGGIGSGSLSEMEAKYNGDSSAAETSDGESSGASSAGATPTERRRARNVVTWKPGLFSITEN